MAAPRTADDDEFRIGQRHDGGQYPVNGLGEVVTDGRRAGLRAGGGSQEAVHVDRRGARPPQAQFAEYLGEGHGPAGRAGRDEVGDLARQAVVPAPDLAVADDRAAQPLAEEQVPEVVQRHGPGLVAFGPRRPVDVVVHRDRSRDVRRQDLDGIQLAEQEGRVGQVDQPPGGTVHRVGGAHDGQTGERAASGPGPAGRPRGDGPQHGGDLLGLGRPAAFSSPRQTVLP